MKRNYRRRLAFTIIVYSYILLSIILFKYMSPFEIFSKNRAIYNGVNFKLFFKLYNQGLSLRVNLTAILGNIMLFIPFGMLMSMKNGKVIINILFGFLLSLFFEGFQYFFEIGSFDVNDILLNTIGAVLGIIIYKIINSFLRKKVADRVVINIGFYIGIVVAAIETILYVVR